MKAKSPLKNFDIGGFAEVAVALASLGVKKAHLVGGITRDALLGKAHGRPDLDLTLPETSLELARSLASVLGGSAFTLDEGEGAYRVVWEGARADLVRWRAPTLEEDLKGRDFTLNAIAADIFTGELFDPLEGREALGRGMLIPCSPDSMHNDPLRALRALRFASRFGFSPSGEALSQMKAAAPRLGAGDVSVERVRDELFKTLDGRHLDKALDLAVETRLLFTLFPFMEEWRGIDQGDYHEFDLLEHSLRAATQIGEVADALGGGGHSWLAAHLERDHEQNVSAGALLRFAALFHDIGKPATRKVEEGGRVRFITHDTLGGKLVEKLLADLRVGKKTARLAGALVAGHMRLYGLAAQELPTARSRLRYVRDLGEVAPEAVILSLADELATGKGAKAYDPLKECGLGILGLWHEIRTAGEEPPPLLMGRDLVQGLGMKEGPAVGIILKKVAEAEERGEISTRDEALALAGRLIKGN